MQERVRFADRHEHTVEVALMKFHTTYLPELSEDQFVWDDSQATSSAAPGRR